MRVETHSADQTRRLGRRLGRAITGPVVVALLGDLGSGKTVLVQGIAQGLEVSDKHYVTSPSYTLINEYPGRLPLYHIDLYRLEGFDDAEAIGLFDLMGRPGVFAVEWAERLTPEMLGAHLAVTIRFVDTRRREIRFVPRGEGLAHLLDAVAAS